LELLQQLEGPSGSDTSKTSLDSVGTEGSSICGQSDIYNTSIDSAFSGSVDQSCDNQRPRTYQMTKTDSGYRSIEVSNKYFGSSMSQGTLEEHNLSAEITLPKLPEQRTSNESNTGSEDCDQVSSKSDSPNEPVKVAPVKIRNPMMVRNRRMWHSICAEPSFMETDSTSSVFALPPEISALAVVSKKRRDIDNGEEGSGKRSVSVRYRGQRRYSINQLRVLQRDYSIDEKSDSLFREFSRNESGMFQSDGWTNTIPRRDRRNRRNVRHLEVGDTSPRSSCIKISPQDSIEEENPLDALSRDSSRTRELSTHSQLILTPTTTVAQ